MIAVAVAPGHGFGDKQSLNGQKESKDSAQLVTVTDSVA
jgi:hypothetical protein